MIASRVSCAGERVWLVVDGSLVLLFVLFPHKLLRYICTHMFCVYYPRETADFEMCARVFFYSFCRHAFPTYFIHLFSVVSFNRDYTECACRVERIIFSSLHRRSTVDLGPMTVKGYRTNFFFSALLNKLCDKKKWFLLVRRFRFRRGVFHRADTGDDRTMHFDH